ncbi:hypothetical protein ACK3F5_18565 [Photorhabdus asymbiotica UENP]
MTGVSERSQQSSNLKDEGYIHSREHFMKISDIAELRLSRLTPINPSEGNLKIFPRY